MFSENSKAALISLNLKGAGGPGGVKADIETADSAKQ